MAMNPRVLKLGLGIMALGLAGYIIGPPLYWHFVEGLAALSRSSSACAPCICDCDSESLPSIPIGLSNASLADCAKHDPDVSEDTQKNFAELLSDELKLRESEALEKQLKSDVALLEAKKITSQYQKEADKCNSGMETCEEAREKAEAALLSQKRLTAVWELRARQRGWKEGVTRSRANVQAI